MWRPGDCRSAKIINTTTAIAASGVRNGAMPVAHGTMSPIAPRISRTPIVVSSGFGTASIQAIRPAA